jgi:hypothetical protein
MLLFEHAERRSIEKEVMMMIDFIGNLPRQITNSFTNTFVTKIQNPECHNLYLTNRLALPELFQRKFLPNRIPRYVFVSKLSFMKKLTGVKVYNPTFERRLR